MGERHPLLAIPGVDQEKQCRPEDLAGMFRPDLFECPIRGQADEDPHDQPEHLPAKSALADKTGTD